MRTKPDRILVVTYILLVLIGWISIFSTSNKSGEFVMTSSYGYQLIWIGTSFLLALFVLLFNYRLFTALSPLLYVVFNLLLVLVIFIGVERSGAKSWIGIGSFGIQPAEFAKYATCLFLACYMSRTHCDLTKWKELFKILIIIAIPLLFILLQNDTGSALPLLFLVFALFREGLTPWILIIGFLAVFFFVLLIYFPKWVILLFVAAFFIWLLWRFRKRKKHYYGGIIVFFLIIVTYIFTADILYNRVLQTHQKQRIELLFGKIDDPKGIGYNVNQAKIAIGSGGFFGKGFKEGTQTKLNFVPEQVTDFIFCTIGEEWGFVGCTVVIFLFCLLIYRIINLSEQSENRLVRIYGYCIACIFFAHFSINIGMTVGLMPVIGIPLPFISYGGSSLWAFTLMLFTFINIESRSHGRNVAN